MASYLHVFQKILAISMAFLVSEFPVTDYTNGPVADYTNGPFTGYTNGAVTDYTNGPVTD